MFPPSGVPGVCSLSPRRTRPLCRTRSFADHAPTIAPPLLPYTQNTQTHKHLPSQETAGVTEAQVENCITGLSQVFFECGKSRLSMDGALLSLSDFGIPDTHMGAIAFVRSATSLRHVASPRRFATSLCAISTQSQLQSYCNRNTAFLTLTCFFLTAPDPY